MDKEKKGLQNEEEVKKRCSKKIIEFGFDIDCIVKDIHTKQIGRVESLTVNKYHEKEYYIEGAGVSKWIAEKHLILVRPPAEVKVVANVANIE